MADGASDRTPTDVSSVDASEESETSSSRSDAPKTSLHSGGDPSISLQTDGIGERLQHANEEALNDADFGIIRLDDEGVVQFFNQYESELSGVAPKEAEGQDFFTQVAPCTNNRLFRGRFKKGVRRGELDETFTYTYTYKMRPTLVDVHLYRDSSGNNWIMVKEY